jgi:hypothetical protein
MAGLPAESSAMAENAPALNATTAVVHVGVFAVHVTPVPVKPGRHAQSHEPVRLVQVALTLQPPLFVAHSFTSVQVTPLPVKPVSHAQVREPGVFVQRAQKSHPPLLVKHSFTSAQVKPVPVQPVEHAQCAWPFTLVQSA